MRQLLCDFSIIRNSESMQTINDKRKYKLQQLFKMLSLSLHTDIESMVNGPVNDSQFKVSPDLNQLTLFRCVLASYICAHDMYSCMVLLLPRKLHRFHLTHIKLFKRNQSAIKYQSILRIIIHNGPILMKLCQPVLGVRFFKTQCRTMIRHSPDQQSRRSVCRPWSPSLV